MFKKIMFITLSALPVGNALAVTPAPAQATSVTVEVLRGIIRQEMQAAVQEAIKPLVIKRALVQSLDNFVDGSTNWGVGISRGLLSVSELMRDSGLWAKDNPGTALVVVTGVSVAAYLTYCGIYNYFCCNKKRC